MVITIHQAICGELNKAWDLLRTTLPDQVVAKKIAFQTDLQDSPPSGISWLPEIRGFAFGDYFLVIKTYPDTSNDVRNGRVFSHCLIINRSELTQLTNISILIESFKSEVDKSVQLSPIVFDLVGQSKVILNGQLQLRFNLVVKVLSNLSSDVGTLIWVGQADYGLAVARLWQILSPSQKENFNFGINFNPNDVPRDKLNFVVIPENLIGKFENKGFGVVKKEDSVELTEFAEQFISGEEGAINRINDFIGAIEAPKPSVKDVSLIAKGIPTYENLNNVDDLKLLSTLANIIAKYSSRDSKGVSVKSKLVKRIALLAGKASSEDVYLLRNFPCESFRESETIICESVSKWCANILFSTKANKEHNFVPFILQIFDAASPNWLVDFIKNTFVDFFKTLTETGARLIWRWSAIDIRVLQCILIYVDGSKSAERLMIDVSDLSNQQPLREINAFALQKHWLRLYATILKFEFDFEHALSEQLKVDNQAQYLDGINVIINGIPPSKILAATLLNDDDRCINISGELCHKQPSLLNSLDVGNRTWQKIWSKAIDFGNELFSGIKNPKQSTYKLFEELLLGNNVDEFLLEQISQSDFGNLLDHPNRNVLWRKMPNGIRRKFLEKTSSKLLESLSKNPTYEVPSDKELSDYIISNAISTFLYYNRSSFKAVLPIFSTYAQLPEYIMKDYVSNYNGRIDPIDSTHLGRLIAGRNFTDTGYQVYYKVSDNSDFRYALSECLHLLDFFTRGVVWLKGLISHAAITEDQWWLAFTEVSIALYNSGPTENKIWREADGQEYDLLFRVTGKESWSAALQKLRNGGCSGVTVKKLLKAMKKDYPNNPQLKTLKDLWENL